MPCTKLWKSDGCGQMMLAQVGVSVWSDPIDGTIWVMAGKIDEGGVRERVVRFDVACGALEGSTTEREVCEFPVSISLAVSWELFGEMKLVEAFDDSAERVVVDPLAFEVAQALVEMFSQCGTNPYARSCMVAMLCIRLAETCSAGAANVNCRGGGFEPWQGKRLEAALSELWRGKVSLQDCAHRCGLSGGHFARLFKRTYGVSFRQFVVRRRLERACELLRETEESVSQIALACGFPDQSSFTRRFSAKMGTPPAAWRKASSQEARAELARCEDQGVGAGMHVSQGVQDELDYAA